MVQVLTEKEKNECSNPIDYTESYEVAFHYQVTNTKREVRKEIYFTAGKGRDAEVMRRWAKDHQHEYRKVVLISIKYQ